MNVTTVPRCERCGREGYGEGVCNTCRVQERMVSQGLRWCRITPLPSMRPWARWHPLAVLGDLELSHSGRGYWIVKGRVPLAVARELYADPAGRDLVWVAGHCMCPPPEEWTTWVLPDGRKVIPSAQEAGFDQFIQSGHFKPSDKAPYVFSDDPASLGASPFVDGYHIDGDLGLRVFVDALIRHGLYRPAPAAPAEGACHA